MAAPFLQSLKSIFVSIFNSNRFPLQDMTKTGNSHFLINDLELAQLTLGQVHAHFQVISIFYVK